MRYSYNPVSGMFSSLQAYVCCVLFSECLLHFFCFSLQLAAQCAFSASLFVHNAVSFVVFTLRLQHFVNILFTDDLSSSADDSAIKTVKQYSAQTNSLISLEKSQILISLVLVYFGQ